MALPLQPGDTGPMVTQMQQALVAKGFSVGPAGADGIFNPDTLSGLEAFQDDNALAIQPLCDQQCWTALGLS
jgi:peptidoglycan hydrolase-like protein with peptidoglycan-binding domain